MSDGAACIRVSDDVPAGKTVFVQYSPMIAPEISHDHPGEAIEGLRILPTLVLLSDSLSFIISLLLPCNASAMIYVVEYARS